jgi:cytidyltransferase-like protein
MKKLGAVVARFQPIHLGHMFLIEKALKECEKVVVVVSSGDKSRTKRNPIKISDRMAMVMDSIETLPMVDRVRVSVISLQDWSDEKDNDNKDWGNFVYYNIMRVAGSDLQAIGPDLSIYYSDDPAIIKEWFSPRLAERVTIVEVNRAEVLDGQSATKVREAIAVGDKSYVRKYCPKPVLQRFDDLSIDIRRSV